MIEFKQQPMIVFDGQPTGQCKRFMLKRVAKVELCIMIMSLCVVMIPLSFLLMELIDPWILYVIVPFVVCTLLVTAVRPFMKGEQSTVLPSKIVIHANGHMESISKSFHWVKMVEEVEQVLDCGAWYQINFIRREKNGYFFCQKDLLTLGTIEDFEKLFEGKIVRK